MEALVFIFAEILFACLAPLLALMGALLGAVLEAVAALLGLAFGSAAGAGGNKKRPATPRKPIVSRKVVHWSAGILGGLGLAGVLASLLLFQPILGAVLHRAGDKAGIALNYDSASGSFFTGRVQLDGLTMVRDSEAGLAFDLTVAEVEADVVLSSLIFGEPTLELGRVAGVTGFVTPPDPKDKSQKVRKERRSFRIDQVLASDVEIEVRPRIGEAYGLSIDTAEVAPLRSRLALFDLLFRSNLSAEVAGQPLRVSTAKFSDNGRETIWAFDNVEADRLKLIVPKAPLTWLNGGQMTVRVEDRWSLSDDEIDMDWRFDLTGIDVVAPADAGAGERLLATGLSKAVARQGGDAAFQYRLDLTKAQVQAMRSGDLNAFWDVVLSGVVGADVQRDAPSNDESGGDSRTKRALGKLKSLFNKEDKGSD